ncbi:S8 family peptidase [Thermococcus alcaliphilus]|uniref:S8 family peptidase n=1 Tax=Thermococcus alcaliphilus TaxID=139207 RepID=UPI00209199C5|nr:S8 family serine peptidase [Thermococcus alcaliphilus]MCO6041312.1 S8 family serine peptidase [Thermococcus alcaliphilus]
MERKLLVGVLVFALLVSLMPVSAVSDSAPKRIFVQIDGPITEDVLNELKANGMNILYVFNEIGFVAGTAKDRDLKRISRLKFVKSVGEDTKVYALSETLPSESPYGFGNYTWNLDMINVPTVHEEMGYTGKGVYIAVLDTGLVPNWRDYFEEDKIATEFARAFLAANALTAHYNPNAWEADTNSHGTHVTSTIIGFWVYGAYRVSGVAPDARVIPVKVLSNYGFGWSTDIAAGIMYIADLYKEEVESGGAVLPPYNETNPIVISMSLGGPSLSPIEKYAIDYAISQGVFIVAAAGNDGEAGMDYPGAYEPVISVGAAGWVGEWTAQAWWRTLDVPEDLYEQVYVTDFSGREKDGQDLDVLAPGSWVVGPYLAYGAAHPPYWAQGVPGQYYYLGGTSMATPHVSGIVALMLQKDMEDNVIDLNQTIVEGILEDTAMPITWYNASVMSPAGVYENITWGDDAVGSGLVQADAAVEAVDS